MKKLLKSLTAIVLAASIIPVYATQKHTATEAEIEEHSTALGITESVCTLIGCIPTYASGIIAYDSIYSLLAPVSKYLATGIAFPGAMVTTVAVMALFELPLLYITKKYTKIYDETSVSQIQRSGHKKYEKWLPKIICSALVATATSYVLFKTTSKMLSPL